ncbi:MAG: hypothetical protein ACFB10_13705 [Salibacteraceae bacterium]
MKLKHLFSVLILSLSLLSYQMAEAQVVVKVRPARPAKVKVKPVKVRAGHTWVAGHWKYNARRNRYIWVEGTWVRTRPGHRYQAGRWVAVRGGGHRWVSGVWVKV